MTLDRRTFLAAAAALPAFAGSAGATPVIPVTMAAVFTQIIAKKGQAKALAIALLDGTEAMDGCLSYIVSVDPANPDGVWVFEAWVSTPALVASWNLPQMRAARGKAEPLIERRGERREVVPIGGRGLVSTP